MKENQKISVSGTITFPKFIDNLVMVSLIFALLLCCVQAQSSSCAPGLTLDTKGNCACKSPNFFLPQNIYQCIDVCPTGYKAHEGSCNDDSETSKELNIEMGYSTFNNASSIDPYPSFNRGRFFDGNNSMSCNFTLNPEFTVSIWVYSKVDDPLPLLTAKKASSVYEVSSLKGKQKWQHIVGGCITVGKYMEESHCFTSSNLSRYSRTFSQRTAIQTFKSEVIIGKGTNASFTGYIYEAKLINYAVEAENLLFSKRCTGSCTFCPLSGVCLLNCKDNEVASGTSCQKCDSRCPYCTSERPCSYCPDVRMLSNCKYFGLFDSSLSLADCGLNMSKKYSKACVVRGREQCCQGNASSYCAVNYDVNRLCSITAADMEAQYTTGFSRISFALAFDNQATQFKNCTEVLDPESVAKLGQIPFCFWRSKSNYEIILGYDAVASEVDLVFKAGTLMMSGGSTTKEGLAITVKRTTAPPKPEIVMQLPPYYNTCTDLVLSAEFSKGLANRNFTAEWKVNGSTIPGKRFELVLKSGSVSGTLNIDLKLTNKFGETASKSFSMDESKYTFIAEYKLQKAKYFASENVVVPAFLTSICKESPAGLQFVWNLQNKTSTTGPLINVPGLTFQPGTNQTVVLELNQNGIVKAKTEFVLEFIPTPLSSKPSIRGNVVLNKWKTVELDLKLSDPDRPGSNNFTVVWNCTSLELKKECANSGRRFLQSNQKYIIPTDWQEPGYTYNLTADATANNKRVTSTALISYTAEKVPGLGVIEPEGPVNPREPFVIKAYIDKSEDSSSYTTRWSQKTKFSASYTTPTAQQTLGFAANSLERGKTYTYEVRVSSKNAFSTAKATFTVNSWPENCAFSISPSSGVELTENFKLQVNECTDPEGDLPFQYQYFSKKSDSSLESLTPLINNPFFKMIMGRYDTDEQVIVARVYDSLMCYAELDTRVIVTAASNTQELASQVAQSTLQSLRESTIDVGQAVASLAAVASTFSTNSSQPITAENVLDSNLEVMKQTLEDADYATLADIVRLLTNSTSLNSANYEKSYIQVMEVLTKTETSTFKLSQTLQDILSNLQIYSESEDCTQACNNRQSLYDAVANVSFASIKNDTINQDPLTYETELSVIKPIRLSNDELNNTQTIRSKSDPDAIVSVNFQGALCSSNCSDRVFDIVIVVTEPPANSSLEENMTLVSDTVFVSVKYSGTLNSVGDIVGESRLFKEILSSGYNVTLPLHPWNSTQVPICTDFNSTTSQFEEKHCKRLHFNDNYIVCGCDILPLIMQSELRTESILDPTTYFMSFAIDIISIIDAEFFIWLLAACMSTVYISGLLSFGLFKDKAWANIVQKKNIRIRKFVEDYMLLYRNHSDSMTDEKLTKKSIVCQIERLVNNKIKFRNTRASIADKIKQIVTEKHYMKQLKLHSESMITDFPHVDNIMQDLLNDQYVMEELPIPIFPGYDDWKESSGCWDFTKKCLKVLFDKVLLESRIWSNWHTHLDWSRPSLRYNYNVSQFFLCCLVACASLNFDQNRDKIDVAYSTIALNYYDKFYSTLIGLIFAILLTVLDILKGSAVFINEKSLKKIEIIGWVFSSLFILLSLGYIVVKASDINQNLLSTWLVNSVMNVIITFIFSEVLITLLFSFLKDEFSRLFRYRRHRKIK